MNGYRTSPQILSEVLLITNSCDRHGVAVTKLCHDANLSHGRLKKLIVKLTDAGLMNKIEYDGKNTFVVTDKGWPYDFESDQGNRVKVITVDQIFIDKL